MIGTSIALAIWTSGLLYITTRAERKMALKTGSTPLDEANLGD